MRNLKRHGRSSALQPHHRQRAHRQGDITENYFAEIIANYFNVPIVNFRATPPDDIALHTLLEQFAKTKRIALFAIDAEKRS